MMMSVKHCGLVGLVAYAILAFVVAVFSPLPSTAAEISCLSTVSSRASAIDPVRLSEHYPSGRRPNPDTCLTVLIKGTVGAGDSAKFTELLRKSHPFLERVLLWSSGGSVEEAMKIGRLIRKGLIETVAPEDIDGFNDKNPIGRGSLGRDRFAYNIPSFVCRGNDCHCASACFLIWGAGVERAGSSLGLHRPTTASTTFAALPPGRASELYRQLLLEMNKYLTEMEVPRRFAEIMMDTSSSHIRWLDFNEAGSLQWPPSIEEWLAATCGAWTRAEDFTMARIGVEMDQKKNVSQRDKILYEQLSRRSLEVSACRAKKIRNSRDAIGAIN